MKANELLKIMVDTAASDLHVKVGSPPCLRKDGQLILVDYPPFTPEEASSLVQELIPENLNSQFKERSEVDFAFSVKDVGRFRANVFRQRGHVGMALRRVIVKQPEIEALGLPPVVAKLAEEPRGLVLVTGTAGSGKTTTLAAIINHINHTRRCHIVTIEDPIEVLHQDIQCIINQREIGIDTESYEEALKHAVRQDPDVILIGEMRDLETVRAALSAAEMGMLVLSTLHTIDSAETVNRIIDFFPPHQQRQVQLLLVATLRGIISLRLLSKTGGGQIPAAEILIATATIKELINENKVSQLKDAIEQGSYYGMQSFDQSLIQLYEEGKIALDDALSMASDAHDFRLKLRKLGVDVGVGNV